MDYDDYTDREGLKRLLAWTEPDSEPTGGKVMHVTKLEGALEGFINGVSQSFARAFCRAGKGLARYNRVPHVHFGVYGQATDAEAIEQTQEALDSERAEMIQGLVALGIAQSAGSAGASGAVVAAPPQTATPMFNPGRVHRLQPGQIPRAASASGGTLPSAIATIVLGMLLQQLLERVGRKVETDDDEKRKCDRCLRNGYRVLSAFRLFLQSESQREAIFTNDNAPRQRRNRKSNKN